MSRPSIPPGYSMVTVSLFGKDIPLFAVPDETMKGIRQAINGLKGGKPVRIKLQSGKHVFGAIKKQLPYGAAVVDVNGKRLVVRDGKVPKPSMKRANVVVEELK